MKKLAFLLFYFTFLCGYGQNNKAKINLSSTAFLELERENFDITNHKFELFDMKFIIGIDNVILFGIDGEPPKFKLKKATLKIADKRYDLQINDMYNPWFGDSINEQLFKIKNTGSQYILQGIFSDGAGTYAAEWLIEGSSSIRTILTRDEDLIIGRFEK